jgi:hypothetical protein
VSIVLLVAVVGALAIVRPATHGEPGSDDSAGAEKEAEMHP